MKKIYLLLFLMATLTVYSQNWAPINTTEKFCYSTDDTLDIINNVLWVDSIEQNGSNQVFHFNKIAKAVANQDFNYLFHEPQFLLDDAMIQENGEWVFMDTFFTPLDTLETFSLFPLAALNDSWVYSEGVDAQVTNLSVMDVLGETDSVKTITLSDNSEILLSKNHGLINWRNQYQLVGIEGRDLGVLVPNFDDMYANISAGDVVCYSINSWIADETVTGFNTSERYDIESVDRYNDSLVIHAFVRSNTEYFWKNNAQETSKGMQDLVFYRNRYTDVYPNDTIYIGWTEYYNYSEGIAISKLAHYKWGGLKKTQETYVSDFPNTNLFTSCEGMYSFELCETNETMLMKQSTKYGFWEYENAGFEWGGGRTLEGVIDDGDTLGTIFPIDMFVGSTQLNTQSNWLVYPNPAHDHIILTSSKTGNMTAQLYNCSGILVKEVNIQKSEDEISIPIATLSSGVYLIKLIQNQQTEVLKFMKE